MEEFFTAILLGVCLSCLESDDLPSSRDQIFIIGM